MLLPALQHLTRLTRLTLSPDVCELHHCERTYPGKTTHPMQLPEGRGYLLPTSLLRLDVQISGLPFDGLVPAEVQSLHPGADLDHLTRLTSLSVVDATGGERLPASLEEVFFAGTNSVQFALPHLLPNLRVLDIDNLGWLYIDAPHTSTRQANVLDGTDLQQLTQLSQLSRLEGLYLKLWYDDIDDEYISFFAALRPLACLPLYSLGLLYFGTFPMSFLPEVGSFKQLTRLSLSQSWWQERPDQGAHWTAGAVRALAGQLQHLTSLRELRINRHALMRPALATMQLAAGPDADCAAEADWRVLLQAAAQAAAFEMH